MKANMIPITKSVMIATALASVWWVSAGSLTPPGGTISPTMKDLDDVEPRTAIRNDFVNIIPIVISFSGSYYLAEDVFAISFEHGIEITANDVTLDLNGFTIYGNTEVGSLDGIHVEAGRDNITIRNGTIRSFFNDGIDADGSDFCVIENVRVLNSGDRGIMLRENGMVSHCIVEGSVTGSGIDLHGRGVISHCIARNNGNGIGFEAGIVIGQDSALIVDCLSYDNGGIGIRAPKSTVSRCIVRNNGSHGIDVANGLVHGCTSVGNGGSQIIAGTSADNHQ